MEIWNAHNPGFLLFILVHVTNLESGSSAWDGWIFGSLNSCSLGQRLAMHEKATSSFWGQSSQGGRKGGGGFCFIAGCVFVSNPTGVRHFFPLLNSFLNSCFCEHSRRPWGFPRQSPGGSQARPPRNARPTDNMQQI